MIKDMLNDVMKEIMLFIPALVACQTLAFAATIFMWSITVFIGAPVGFLMLWKFLALFGLIVAIAAQGQMKAKGIIP